MVVEQAHLVRQFFCFDAFRASDDGLSSFELLHDQPVKRSTEFDYYHCWFVVNRYARQVGYSHLVRTLQLISLVQAGLCFSESGIGLVSKSSCCWSIRLFSQEIHDVSPAQIFLVS